MGETFLPRTESLARLARTQNSLQKTELDGMLVFDPVNLFYFTGTMPDGVLFIPAGGDALLFVRRSVERARLESPLEEVIPYQSFKDLLPVLQARAYGLERLGLEESFINLALYNLLKKYFTRTQFSDISPVLKKVRAVKSAYELDKIRRAAAIAGEINARLPGLLIPGISEWELGLQLFPELVRRSRNCLARINGRSREFFLGNICFNTSSLYPSAFDGPGGMIGFSPACPWLGSDKRLKRGDLVYIDLGYSYEEYYVDKTRIFSLGKTEDIVRERHAFCCAIQAEIQKQLKPGAIPAQIYENIQERFVLPAQPEHFMGYKSNQVKFLGHGIGLEINEYPALAPRFDEPLEENMVLAVEPKLGLADIGMVGIENTFLVTAAGGLKLTADDDDITIV